MPRSLSLALLALIASCGPPARPPTQPTSKPAVIGATLVLAGSQPAHANVIVDGKPVGKLGVLAAGAGLSVTSGVHRIEVRAPDYRTFRLELRFEPGRREPLRITLERVKKTYLEKKR